MNEIQTLQIALNAAVKNGAFETAAQVVNAFTALQSLAAKIQELEKIKQDNGARQ